MTDDGSKLLHHKTEFDDWRSLTIGIYMALVGYAVMVGLPVISTAWVGNLGFSEVEVGRVAGADLGGLAIGAVISALFVARVDRRRLVAGAALVTGCQVVSTQLHPLTRGFRTGPPLLRPPPPSASLATERLDSHGLQIPV